MMGKMGLALVATASLAAGSVLGQSVSAPLIESIRALASARATLDLCMVSPDFKKLADATQRRTVAISNRVNHLSNDIHESPKGKLLYVSYSISVSQQTASPAFRQALTKRRNGVCDFKLIEAMQSQLQRTERLIRKHL